MCIFSIFEGIAGKIRLKICTFCSIYAYLTLYPYNMYTSVKSRPSIPIFIHIYEAYFLYPFNVVFRGVVFQNMYKLYINIP